YRMPVFNTWLGRNKLQLAAFLDFGRSWNRERATATPEDISSAGIGIRWAPTNNIYGDIYWGKRLRTVTNPDNDLQDDGIHFQFQITL
ncbi:MAG: BamA/TamA family outer membrane protein, partial [Gammaproteobacteria bacterium]|nr:BamA/TamA family outer membrane protein [Gammaproteobacteria bacterium]